MKDFEKPFDQPLRLGAVTRSFNDWPSFNHEIITHFQKKISAEWETHLTQYLLKNLAPLGFSFENVEDFHSFIKQRVSRISFTEDLNTYQFYLDFKDEENRGILIGEYSEQMDFKYTENTISCTIGKSFRNE